MSTRNSSSKGTGAAKTGNDGKSLSGNLTSPRNFLKGVAMEKKRFVSIGLLTIAFALSACESGAPRLGMREKGALTGGALGAGLGAIVGNQVGSSGAGIAIGGATGALAGALVGEAQDQQEEDREGQDERLRRQEEELRRQRRELEELRRGERSYEDDYRYDTPSRGSRYDDRRY